MTRARVVDRSGLPSINRLMQRGSQPASTAVRRRSCGERGLILAVCMLQASPVYGEIFGEREQHSGLLFLPASICLVFPSRHVGNRAPFVLFGSCGLHF
jgi:hypothetical protein